MPELDVPPINYDERLQEPNIFRQQFEKLTDEAWKQVLLRSIDEPEIDGVAFPRFPDADLQSRIHGSSAQAAIEEGFAFYQYVKSQVGAWPLRPAARMLDFGAGWGRITRPYMRHQDLSNIYAFEPSRLFCTIARSLNPHVNILSGEYLPNRRIPRHMFDLIVGYSVFSHLSQHATSLWLREMAELLIPGGWAVFTTWGERFLAALLDGKAKLDAGQEIHWYHKFVIDRTEDLPGLLQRYRAGEFVWIDSGLGPLYGESFIGPGALNQIIAEHALPLTLVRFDAAALPQDVFIIRRT